MAYAGFWIRVVAWVIDAVALGILTSALVPLVGVRPILGAEGAANAYGAPLGIAYFVGSWSWKGQTIGMMPLGLWVVRAEDGGRPDVVRAFLRYVGVIISFAILLLGVIWVAFDARKQGWHDNMANTLVVRR